MKTYTPFHRNLFALLGVFVTACIVVCILHTNWVPVRQALGAARNPSFMVVAIAVYVAGLFLRGLRTRLIVSPDAKLSVFTASNIVIAGYAVNNIIPARAGELVRAAMLSERTGLPFVQSATVVFLERVLDGLVIVGLLCVAAPLSGFFEAGKETIVFMGPLLCGCATGIALFVAAPNRILGRVSKCLYAVNPCFHDRVMRFFTTIVNGVAYLRTPVHTCKAAIVSLLIWLCDAGFYLLLLPTFGLEADVFFAVTILALVNLSIVFIPAVPGYSSPGNIGPFHLVCMQTLVLAGAGPSVARNYAITAHLSIFLPLMLWGSAIFLWYGWTLRKTRTLSQNASDVSAPPEQVCDAANRIGALSAQNEVTHPSRFLVAMTEAALPATNGHTASDETTIHLTASFIHREINNLPKTFRFLLNVGLFGFRFLVFLRYLSDFPNLPLPVRSRAFNAWAYGSLAPARKLFKMVRSTALLGFYEYSADRDMPKKQPQKANPATHGRCPV